MNFVDIDNDRKMLLEDLELSERAKNTLRRFLRVKTFGDLLNVDYEMLVNTRSLGSITLEEIKSFVRSKGYFLFNEKVSWKEKKDLLKINGYKLLEDEGLGYDESRYFYVNNFFTLDDIFYYGKDIFYLKGFGRVKQEELKIFLEKVPIILVFKKNTELLKKYSESKRKNEQFDIETFNEVFINEIGDLYLGTRKILIKNGIVTLKDLIEINYNELKDKVCDISDIELLELINFLRYYNLEIKGYDQTISNVRTLNMNIEEEQIDKQEKENLDIAKRIAKKQDLVNRYQDAITKYHMLQEEEARLDLEIVRILEEMEKVKNYGKGR